MMEFLDGLSFWHWWILGVGLVVLEALVPGVVFMWMGIAAGFTGLILIVFSGLQWEHQVLVFATLSVISVLGGRMWVIRHPTQTDHPNLNRRCEQYVGRVFTLEKPVINGVGKLRIDDTTWKISSEDLPAGVQVMVTGVDGVILVVEKNGAAAVTPGDAP